MCIDCQHIKLKITMEVIREICWLIFNILFDSNFRNSMIRYANRYQDNPSWQELCVSRKAFETYVWGNVNSTFDVCDDDGNWHQGEVLSRHLQIQSDKINSKKIVKVRLVGVLEHIFMELKDHRLQPRYTKLRKEHSFEIPCQNDYNEDYNIGYCPAITLQRQDTIILEYVNADSE